jgi:hypothetical protein
MQEGYVPPQKRREVKPNLLANVAMMTGQMDYQHLL